MLKSYPDALAMGVEELFVAIVVPPNDNVNASVPGEGVVVILPCISILIVFPTTRKLAGSVSPLPTKLGLNRELAAVPEVVTIVVAEYRSPGRNIFTPLT
jgi:hypothetical protein